MDTKARRRLPTCIWGHSFASQIIIAAYQKRADIFSNLILINAFADNPLKKSLGGKYALLLAETLCMSQRKMPRPLTAVWKTVVNHPLTLRLSALAGGFNLELSSYRDLEVYSRGVSSMNLDVFTSLFEEMLSFQGQQVLRKISVPTLIIGGSKDSVTPLAYQMELHASIPQSEFLAVPLGSHCTPLDMPELVNLRIEKFLNSVY